MCWGYKRVVALVLQAETDTSGEKDRRTGAEKEENGEQVMARASLKAVE